MFAWQKSRLPANPEALLLRLPTQDAVVAGVDFDALRGAGLLRLLTDAKVAQDAEYVTFVRESGFDYQRDLHYVLVSFAPDGEFFLIRGAFDWSKLRDYASRQKGSCAGALCRMAGSTPDRKISYLPLSRDWMALAVAPEEGAAARLEKPGPQDDVTVPREPVWLTFSAGALRHAASLSGSSRLFATAMMDAERVTITAGAGSHAEIEARLEAICRDAQQAGALTAQLQGLTNVLKTAAQQDGPGNAPDGLSTVLGSGTFAQAGSHVAGQWPIPRALLTTITQ